MSAIAQFLLWGTLAAVVVVIVAALAGFLAWLKDRSAPQALLVAGAAAGATIVIEIALAVFISQL